MKNPASVSLIRCETYEADLRPALTRLLAPLGGLTAFVRSGQRVLIKPNLLSDRAPEAAVTTHPAVVRALIRMVREAGAQPVVGDSPCNAVKIERVWEATGFARLCAEEKVALINFEAAGAERVKADGFVFYVARPVLEADVVLNCPKVKTHTFMILSGGVKNLYGTIPGFLKTHLHGLYPRPAAFGCLLAALYRRVAPALSVADGVWGMEGDGPSAGRPIPLGFLAASADAVALDCVLCDLLGIPRRAVASLRPFRAVCSRTLPTTGDPLEALRPRSFHVPGTLLPHLIPGPLVRMLSRWIWVRPEIEETCVACGRCLTVCPQHALRQDPGQPPALIRRRCIGCCCCHEACPERAISMRPSRLLTRVMGSPMAK